MYGVYRFTKYSGDSISKKLNVKDITYAIIINNILFARPLLDICTQNKIPIVSDLHVFSNLDDAYNQPWLEASDILFFSCEKVEGDIEVFVRTLVQRFPKQLVIVGMGKEGSLLYEADNDTFYYQPIFNIGEVKNTIGAGDSLCSSFTYMYFGGKSARESLAYATYFDAYKIQFSGGAEGFLDGATLEQKYLEYIKNISTI